MVAWTLSSLPDLSEDEFAVWLKLLEERTGISFENHRRILQVGLTQRMREIGSESYDEYLSLVTSDKQAAVEWTALLRTLTVKETRFARDLDALEFLKKYIYQKLTKEQGQSAIELWSVACSTGEEPYSLAMLMTDMIERVSSQRLFGITATDICLSSLSVARKGVYPNRRLETLDKSQVGRYFQAVDDKRSAVSKELKDRICFAKANIIELEKLPVNDMDVIYCQNVLIYFKRWRQQAVLDELVERLKPKGLLIVGMGEATGWHNPKVVRLKHSSVQAYIKSA